MKKHRIRIRIKIYPILWSGIILISVYLLIRFAAISFSDDMGQANLSFKDALLSSLYSKVIESGSSLISYTSNLEENAFTFPISLVTDEFVLQEFAKDNTLTTAKAQEYSSLFNPYVSEVEEAEEKADEEIAKQTEETSKFQGGIGFHDVVEGVLSKEYILSNGAIFSANINENTLADANNINSEQLQIGYLQGEIIYEETEDDSYTANQDSVMATLNADNKLEYTMEQLKDISFLVRNFYIVAPSTKVTDELFDAEILLGKDMTIKQENDAPQILILHTHSQEAFVDSRKNKKADTVVGVGSYLTEILEDQYGYNVIHDTTTYDIVNGELDRNFAYKVAEKGITKTLKENPTIEVVIDLHRDAYTKRVTIIDGEETAQIMLFNGLSRDQNGPLTKLDNPNLQDNLAFSLQLQLKSLDLYPGLFYKNYLQYLRYNMHLMPKYLLMELGTEENTLQSAKNAMEPFAEILDSVLQGK
ncbi:MAG: stage II sporulation protein P [Mobilitalea sp.]